MTEQLSQASPDLLRQLGQTFAEALMSADADAVCGAGYGQRSPDRSHTRNRYRPRSWETSAGSIDLAIPKLREGSYCPEWLLERRRMRIRLRDGGLRCLRAWIHCEPPPADGAAQRCAE